MKKKLPPHRCWCGMMETTVVCQRGLWVGPQRPACTLAIDSRCWLFVYIDVIFTLFIYLNLFIHFVLVYCLSLQIAAVVVVVDGVAIYRPIKILRRRFFDLWNVVDIELRKMFELTELLLCIEIITFSCFLCVCQDICSIILSCYI